MAPTAAFLVLLALMSDPFCFHHNGTIWAPNVPLLTLLRPILVIAACSHISYAGNTHNNHIIASLRRTSHNHVHFKPPPFHQNGIIWAPNAPLLTLRRPILVIAACSHISYAGNTHNNHKIASLRRTSRNHVRFKLHPKTTTPCWSGNKASLFTRPPDPTPAALELTLLLKEQKRKEEEEAAVRKKVEFERGNLRELSAKDSWGNKNGKRRRKRQ